MTRITARLEDETEIGANLSHFPDCCPFCSKSVHPRFLVAVADVANKAVIWVRAAFQCTTRDCRRVFVGDYIPKTVGSTQMRLCEIHPKKSPKRTTFGEIIEPVSPRFVEIFNQASVAEELGLKEIGGMGYRKAIEFLIKDFLIAEKPGSRDEIERSLLGECIAKHVEDERLKLCASRAVWLGNDETHYCRKWEDKDIGDLKTLIKLSVNWMESVLLTKKYAADMPKGK